jgi:filamentous hemagglutinin family protein
MNKSSYRKIFSKRLGMLVAVAESAHSQGKHAGEGPAGGETISGRVVSYLSGSALAVLSLFAVSISYAQSLPTGGVVTAGSASISSPNSNTLNIDQNSQRAVINWNTFDIGSNNTVRFNQPNSQAAALNIVSGGQMSNIQGALLANGQILIQNASGILFGSGSVVNVGSLLATTKNINTGVFMAGSPFSLSGMGNQASIANNGSITATGYVTLLADQVKNNGNISAGTNIVLAAGDSATVALTNGQGIHIVLTNATANALIQNNGTVQAGNAVLLTGRGSDTLLNTVINLSGVVKAGTVVADAGNSGDVVVTGSIDAGNVTGTGGTVILSGNRVGMFGDASITASGNTQGGTVIIGGDSLHKLSGSGAAGLIDNVTFADFVQVGTGASIDTSATNGKGGFIETSGHSLGVQGTVMGGDWLIDPTDVYISTSADSGYSGSLTGGTFNGGLNVTAYVNNTTISDALNSGASVTITTVGSTGAGPYGGGIVQNIGADIVTNNAASLTLIANTFIALYGNITEVGAGKKLNLTLTADAGGTGRGQMWQESGTTISLGGGNLTISGNMTGTSGYQGVVLVGALKNIGGGSIRGSADDYAGVSMNLSAPLIITTGVLTINGTSNSSYGIYTNSTNLSVAGLGSLNIIGRSRTESGVAMITPTLNVNGGSMTIVGTTTNLDPSAHYGDGVDLWSPLFNVKNGLLNIIGTTAGIGNGVYMDSPGGNITGGFTTITGTAFNNEGILVTGPVTIAGSGLGQVCSNGIDVSDGFSCGDTSSGGGSGGGGGAGAGAAVGLVVLGGGAAFLLSGGSSADYLYLPSPGQIEATGDGSAFWADVTVQQISVDSSNKTADVLLLDKAGPIERQLKYTDAADGTNHYRGQSETSAENFQAELSVNTQNNEYFYTETGMQKGKSYTVKAHGWLKRGTPPNS